MRIKESLGDRFFMISVYFILTIILIIVLFPLIYVVSASFSSPSAVTSGKVWLWPVEFSLDGYIATFRDSRILTGYINSFIYTFLFTIISVVLTILIAYPLSRKTFWGRSIVMFFILFSILFECGLIRLFVVVYSVCVFDTS